MLSEDVKTIIYNALNYYIPDFIKGDSESKIISFILPNEPSNPDDILNYIRHEFGDRITIQKVNIYGGEQFYTDVCACIILKKQQVKYDEIESKILKFYDYIKNLKENKLIHCYRGGTYREILTGQELCQVITCGYEYDFDYIKENILAKCENIVVRPILESKQNSNRIKIYYNE